MKTTLHELCLKHKLTLCCAESMSGGAFSASITRNSMASRYFLGGVVSYSTLSKIEILKVPSKIIDTYGVYSTQCVVAMAQGVKALFNADIAVSISGEAQKSDSSSDSLLEIYSCIIFRDKIETFKDSLSGTRIDIIQGMVDVLHERCISLIERGYYGQE